METRLIAYDFEQAASLDELEAKVISRLHAGWSPLGEPRLILVKLAHKGSQLCYSQTLVRRRCADTTASTNSPFPAAEAEASNVTV